MEIVSNIALISINETLIVQLLSFLIFLFIINRLMFKPLRAVMDERDQYIGNLKSDIGNAEMELNKVANLLKRQEEATRGQAHDLRKDLEEAGNQQAGHIFAAVRKEVAELKERVEEEVENQLAEARKYLDAESDRVATHIMEKILDRRLGA